MVGLSLAVNVCSAHFLSQYAQHVLPHGLSETKYELYLQSRFYLTRHSG